ncbi:MAG: hypothetical protein ACYC6C_05565 [Coriobacteriia bacterium]
MDDKIKKVFDAFAVSRVYIDEKAGEVYLTEKANTKPLNRVDFEKTKVKTKKEANKNE